MFSTICVCALANPANGQDYQKSVSTTTLSVTSSDEKAPSYGVSIGTVEAQLYSESGLKFSNWSSVNYVAKVSDGTYMGFNVKTSKEYDDETGEYRDVYSACLHWLNSTEEAVTIPDAIEVDNQVCPVVEIGSNSRYSFNEQIKILTIPSSVNEVYVGSNNYFDRYLEAIYMLGNAPRVSGSFHVPEVYVCDKQYFASFANNKGFSNSGILPYGWDFEWVTVDVKKNGEFAETYLTQNDYNWGAAQYVKVTGNINDVDLSAIKNLTSLMKLDLSETSITSLPAGFMRNRQSLVEVKLPSTLNSIGNYGAPAKTCVFVCNLLL